MGSGTKRVRQRVLHLAVALLSGWLFAGVALAQTEAEETPADSRSTAFQAVEGAVEEDIAGGPLLLATYGVIWLVLFLYVFRLIALQKRTQGELDDLRRELAESAASAGTD